jgi:hypothetical protein
MHTREELQPLVTAGAALLDAREPGWDRPGLIELEWLDLSNARSCVLGYTYRHRYDATKYDDGYDAGIDALDIEGREAEFGFTLPDDFPDDMPDERAWAERGAHWKLLTELWRAEIIRRRTPQQAND